MVKLVPVAHRPSRREFGALRGKLVVTKEFFEPLPENELAGGED